MATGFRTDTYTAPGSDTDTERREEERSGEERRGEERRGEERGVLSCFLKLVTRTGIELQIQLCKKYTLLPT